MMEEIENISPVLADTVMDAGYHAIDVLFTKVSYYSLAICTMKESLSI